MTVHDLIKLLQKYEPNTPILIEDIEQSEYDPCPELKCKPIYIVNDEGKEVEMPGVNTVYM